MSLTRLWKKIHFLPSIMLGLLLLAVAVEEERITKHNALV
jgi:hypothetical protein